MIDQATLLSRPKERRPFRPYGAALKMWRSKRREVLMCGPGNTGKSRACLEKLHFCADKYPNTRMLMVRKTRKSLTQSAMVTYEQKVLPQGWLDNLIHFRTQEQQYEYPNGSIIAVAGMDDADKIQSSEWDMAYVQEATELTVNDWEVLTKCLRNKQMPYQQLIADCNPSYPTHWLKQRCDRGATLMLDSRHEDNPSITDEDIAVLEALTGVRYLRLRKGIWAAAEGMVYESWDSAIHKVNKQQLLSWGILTEDDTLGKSVKEVVAAVDWGFTNPGYIGVFALDGDRRAFLIHEVYRTQRTDDWWVAQGKELKATYGIRAFICDPSEPAYIVKFKANGLNAIEAVNDIAPGISAMQERLKVAGDGRTRLCVYEHSLRDRDELREKDKLPCCFEDEILEYVWPKQKDGQPVKEVPVKVNDHSLDAVRYLCLWLGVPTADAYLADLKRRQELQQQRAASHPMPAIPSGRTLLPPRRFP